MAPQPSESPLDVSSIELDQLHPSPSHPVSSTDGQSCPNTQNAPVLIAWESLKKYVVPPPPPPSLLSNKLQGKPEPKEILSSVSGYAAPGEVLGEQKLAASRSSKSFRLDFTIYQSSDPKPLLFFSLSPSHTHTHPPLQPSWDQAAVARQLCSTVSQTGGPSAKEGSPSTPQPSENTTRG